MKSVYFPLRLQPLASADKHFVHFQGSKTVYSVQTDATFAVSLLVASWSQTPPPSDKLCREELSCVGRAAFALTNPTCSADNGTTRFALEPSKLGNALSLATNYLCLDMSGLKFSCLTRNCSALQKYSEHRWNKLCFK